MFIILSIILINFRDFDYPDEPKISKLEEVCALSQNSPNLRFILQNIGANMFENINEEDAEEVFLVKEFCLDVWDYANTLLQIKHVETRLGNYLDLICQTCPKVRSLHILCLSYIENSGAVTTMTKIFPFPSMVRKS